jgi:DNA mismatch repair protein MutS
MLYDDYEGYVKKHKTEYGENTLVLMQCGSFYELYDDGSKQTDLRKIGELLNIQVSRRNKSIIEISRNNLEMAGFPSYTLNKFLNTLVSNNYTCVIVSQTTPPPNPKREITDIVSPGTYVEDDITADGNYLMSIYVEEFCEYKTNKLSITAGASLIDLGTGKTYVFECASKSNDVNNPLDELYRLIITYNPREVIICGKLQKDNVSVLSFEKIVSHLDLEGKCVHNDFDKISNEIFKTKYQEEVLKTVYPLTGLLTKVEYLNLDRMPCATVSFVRILQFVHNHNENILKKVRTPNILEVSKSLVLSYNSIKQLDILPRNHGIKTGSLLDILNNCRTAVGKRYFKERLLNPLNDVDKLNESYYNISKFIQAQNSSRLLDNIKDKLSSIYDLERLFRKIDMGTIHPYEIGYIVISLNGLNDIIRFIMENTKSVELNECNLSEVLESNKAILQVLGKKLNIDELLKYNMDNISPTIFIEGMYPSLDELYAEMNSSKEYVFDIAEKLNKLSVQENTFKVENNDRDGYYILVTNKRFQEFMKSNSKMSIETNRDTTIMISEIQSKSVSQTSTSLKVTHKSFKSVNDMIEMLSIKIRRIAIEEFKKLTCVISGTTTKYSINVTKCLALVDFYWCCSYNAFNYKYNRPEISNDNNDKSFLKVADLRHPIIEKLNNDIAYVANDISLGEKECDGILLYGLNSSGKSSLMKSIGIAVLMAQAGMYVACKTMEYYPYEYIFTRIFSSDDIFKGQSTFTKEMMELRGILKRANSNSLVLGDELCSGTESISALSIVSAGVFTLAQRKSSFIFATHLHDLITIPLVKELQNVKTYHLSVEYDNVAKCLLYDRKLKPGNGSSLYGLEVCKSLDLEQDFLDIANKVRQGILSIESNIVSETSNHNKYNRDVYKDKCQVCGSKAKEIHHINEQYHADADGFIEGKYHKNSKFNLVCLCDICHDNVHHGKLQINGYKQTSQGVVLDYTTEAIKHQDVDDNTVIILNDIRIEIEELLKINQKMKRKDIIMSLRNKFPDADVSTYRIGKIITEVKQL